MSTSMTPATGTDLQLNTSMVSLPYRRSRTIPEKSAAFVRQ